MSGRKEGVSEKKLGKEAQVGAEGKGRSGLRSTPS
jgi:hypothetical protein